MELAIGFITYNESSVKYLPYFLPSLDKAIKNYGISKCGIFVFDNGDLIENKKIIDDFSSKSDINVNYSSVQKNIGFSSAYNAMISKAVEEKFKYFLVINPDTILDENSIVNLLKAIKGNSELASVSPRIMSWDFKNLKKTEIIDSLGLKLSPGLVFSDIGQGVNWKKFANKDINILGPSGAAALFRLDRLNEIAEFRKGSIQYFDERFFMYKEDCDLAYRLFIAGYKSSCVKDAIIFHDRTMSSFGSGILTKITKRRQQARLARSWSFRNQHLIFLKHWKKQNLVNRIRIIKNIASLFFFSLIFERFLLKEYFNIIKLLAGNKKA